MQTFHVLKEPNHKHEAALRMTPRHKDIEYQPWCNRIDLLAWTFVWLPHGMSATGFLFLFRSGLTSDPFPKHTQSPATPAPAPANTQLSREIQLWVGTGASAGCRDENICTANTGVRSQSSRGWEWAGVVLPSPGHFEGEVRAHPGHLQSFSWNVGYCVRLHWNGILSYQWSGDLLRENTTHVLDECAVCSSSFM